jgi:hypothetical protein
MPGLGQLSRQSCPCITSASVEKSLANMGLGMTEPGLSYDWRAPRGEVEAHGKPKVQASHGRVIAMPVLTERGAVCAGWYAGKCS